MQAITDEFLDVSKEEAISIKHKLKKNEYARLEVLLRHPHTYQVISPLHKE